VQTSVFQEGGAEDREQEQESLQEHSAMWVVMLHIKTILRDHTVMRHIMMFWSMMDCIYDGPIRL
jgi:hypothetical protein